MFDLDSQASLSERARSYHDRIRLAQSPDVDLLVITPCHHHGAALTSDLDTIHGRTVGDELLYFLRRRHGIGTRPRLARGMSGAAPCCRVGVVRDVSYHGTVYQS